MNFSVFLFCLLGIQVFCFYVGHRCGSGVSSDRESYFLAGRSLKVFPLMMTFIATQIGGGVLLGAAEEAFSYGYGVVLYPFGVSLGLILLGMGPGRKLASGSLFTVVAIFEVVYRSKALRKIAFFLSAVSLFFYSRCAGSGFGQAILYLPLRQIPSIGILDDPRMLHFYRRFSGGCQN